MCSIFFILYFFLSHILNNDAVDSQASKFLRLLKNKQTQSAASPYFFQVAIDQFVLIPKTHLSNDIRESTFFAIEGNKNKSIQALLVDPNTEQFLDARAQLQSLPNESHRPLFETRTTQKWSNSSKQHAFFRAAFLRRAGRFGTNQQLFEINRKLKSKPTFVYKPKENHADLHQFLQESRLPKSQPALQNALKAPSIGIEPIQEIYNKLHFALKSKDQSIQDQATPIPTVLSSFFASFPPGTKLQTYNATFRDYLAQHKKYRQSLKRYLSSHSPVCSTCHLQHKHDQNPNGAPTESEQHLFFDCPKTKLHLQNLEITLDRWLKNKSKGKVSILDLWPQTTVPIPKLLFWFILGYVPGNLSKLSKQHRAFGSASNLLDTLLSFVEQTVKHIKKTKKLADATHFLDSQEH